MKHLKFTILALLALLLVGINPIIAQDDSNECEDGFRLFDHEFLATDPVCIPENPERVVPIDPVAIEFMFINDMQPVVTSFALELGFASTFPDIAPLFSQLTEGLSDVGFPPNPEVVLSANPDLIIASPPFLTLENYDEMAEIAPIAYFDAPFETFGQGWKSRVDFVGQALNMTEEADEILDVYEARIEALREEVGEGYEDITISVANVIGTEFGVRLAGSFSGLVLDDIGFARPESQQSFLNQTGTAIGENISRELWPDINADYVMIYEFAESFGATVELGNFQEALADDPIWNALDSVQENRIYPVADFWNGFGVLAAHGILDDLFIIVAETEPTIANPYTFEALSGETTEPEATEEASDES